MNSAREITGVCIYSAEALQQLEQRLAAFDQTREPGALWPGLSEAARVSAAREIERVVRDVLAARLPVLLDPHERHDAYALAIAGHTTGAGPLVGRWIEDGLVSAWPAAHGVMVTHLVHARRRAERIARELQPALAALQARGITPIVLKGFHTAAEYFEEPGVRRMSDVDLFIEPALLRDAKAALTLAGFRLAGDPLLAHKQEWIGAHDEDRIFSVELSDERTRWVIELHSSLARIFPAGTVAALDDLQRDTVMHSAAGVTFRVLEPHALLLMLACHCSEELGSSRLLRLIEIVRVVRTERARQRLQWSVFLDLLERTQAAQFAYPALALAEQLAPGTIDPRVIATCARASTWAARHTVKRLVPA
ncbi:MAG: hypothetical protein JWM95_4415, partial [Gemmatimonadetes bacterium]|nr:hypothetical protein [Gemmatimonadota bacterium]